MRVKKVGHKLRKWDSSNESVTEVKNVERVAKMIKII